MYFTKIISRNFILVEGYEDEVLSRGFSLFSQLFFENNAWYLIYVKTGNKKTLGRHKNSKTHF